MQDQQQVNSANEHPQGYILCGGKSRRFGSDKARFQLQGIPLLTNLSRILSTWTSRIVAVAESPCKYDDLKIETIADIEPNLGPLGGLLTSLNHARTTSTCPWVVLLSCDMTDLNTDWLDELWTATQNKPELKAVLFQESSPQLLHPFPGLYHVDLIEQISSLIEKKQLSMTNLIYELGEKAMKKNLPVNWSDVPQINTQDDLEQWKRSNM